MYQAVSGGIVMEKKQANKIVNGKTVIPLKIRYSFEDVLKRGIYMQLYNQNMLSDSQLNSLIKSI